MATGAVLDLDLAGGEVVENRLIVPPALELEAEMVELPSPAAAQPDVVVLAANAQEVETLANLFRQPYAEDLNVRRRRPLAGRAP